MPLQHFLKQYFSQNKKHGSKDRKWISHFCYSFYRLGKALPGMSIDERLPIGVYLCSDDVESFGDYLPETWLRTDNLDTKIQYAETYLGFVLETIFPYQELLMPGIELRALCKSFLQQPDVFLRIRPKKEEKVVSTLEQSSIAFEKVGTAGLRIKGRVAVDQVLEVNKDVVVQDLHSQAIAGLFPNDVVGTIWDCCAASGGKTLLARDCFPKAHITVSDIRPSILQNHKKRMQEAGVNIQRYFVQDLTQPIVNTNSKYDLIICDVPCTGSGTWARTPEELYFFDKKILISTILLQLTIVDHTFAQLKTNGYLLYITCSLFAAEDNQIIDKAIASLPFSIERKDLLIGIDQGADTMYGCLLKRIV